MYVLDFVKKKECGFRRRGAVPCEGLVAELRDRLFVGSGADAEEIQEHENAIGGF